MIFLNNRLLAASKISAINPAYLPKRFVVTLSLTISKIIKIIGDR